MHNRFIIDIHIERSRNCRTSISVLHFNSENQRIVVCGLKVAIEEVIRSEGVIPLLTALVPSISSSRIIIAINPCNEVYVCHVCSFITCIRVTVDGNNRIATHINLGGSDWIGVTAVTKVNVSGINVGHRIAVINPGLFAEMRTMNARNHKTVSCPNVVERVSLERFIVFIFLHKYREIQLSSLADVLSLFTIVEHNNVVRSDKTRNILMYAIQSSLTAIRFSKLGANVEIRHLNNIIEFLSRHIESRTCLTINILAVCHPTNLLCCRIVRCGTKINMHD